MPVVLIVEDDIRLRQMVDRMLTARGFETVLAANGQEALDQMHRQRPDAVLLDLQMPVMDGWEFRRRQLGDPALAAVPVICVTAYSDDTARMQATGVRILQKPYQFEEVVGALHSACQPSAAESARFQQ